MKSYCGINPSFEETLCFGSDVKKYGNGLYFASQEVYTHHILRWIRKNIDGIRNQYEETEEKLTGVKTSLEMTACNFEFVFEKTKWIQVPRIFEEITKEKREEKDTLQKKLARLHFQILAFERYYKIVDQDPDRVLRSYLFSLKPRPMSDDDLLTLWAFGIWDDSKECFL